MANLYVDSNASAPWVASTAYLLGQRVVATRVANSAYQRNVFECTTAGTTGATEPAAWSNVPGTVITSGTAQFTTRLCDSWANACYYLDYMANTAQPGDTVYVSHVHNEINPTDSSVSTLYGTNATSTAANPVRHLCVNTGTMQLATGAIVKMGTGFKLRQWGLWHGIAFYAGWGSASIRDVMLPYEFEDKSFQAHACTFTLASTSSGSRLHLGGQSGAVKKTALFRNCAFAFSHTSSGIVPGNGRYVFQGCTFAATGTVPGTLFFMGAAAQGGVHLSGCDLSAIATIISTGTMWPDLGFTLDGCKLHPSAVLSINPPTVWGTDLLMTASDSTNNPLRFLSQGATGQTVTETTRVRTTSGATDGTTPYAWKMTTTSAARYLFPLVTPPLSVWNETVGGPRTLTVEILHDSLTALNDNEVWLEVGAFESSATPLRTWTTDGSDALAAGAPQEASTTAWVTTGLTNPNTQKLTVTVTPQLRGPILARVCLAKASTTVYIDPRLA